MYEALDEIRNWPPAKDVFDQFSKLSAYMERFESLPNVKRYMSTDTFKELSFFGPTVLRRYQESSLN